mgnify:CR=1 FL=1
MNIYLRFFESEILVSSLSEAFDFLQSIPDIDVDEFLMNDLTQYIESDIMYPKRYKVRGRAYFIVIKTTASTLEEFKEIGLQAKETSRPAEAKERAQDIFLAQNIGWYDATINFKRVVCLPQTQKFQYCDTTFKARLKACCIQECYDRVIDHLRSRGDIDPRSQFPSIKGRNFECVFLGENPE